MSLIERFTSQAGNTIRVRGTDDSPSFCAKDVCDALSIVGYRNKVARLDTDEKFVYVERTGRGRREMVFVTEPGLYKIILTCRQACIPGTPAHAFTRWVTHDVLPSIRRTQRYELIRRLKREAVEEKGRRLWNVVKGLDIWNFRARRKYFGRVCQATTGVCYLDEFQSPHVRLDNLEAAKQLIRTCMSNAIVDDVPEGQTLITNFFTQN